MAAAYSALGHDLHIHQPTHETDTSYDSFRDRSHVNEKHTRRVSFQLPDNITVPFQELSSKIRGQNYRQIQHPIEGLWNPAWLSGLSFLIFAAWYMLLLFATAALYLFSSRNSGIAGQTYAHRYSWTYGPTAVLALTLSLWSHVEYWCKELTPWYRMRRASTPTRTGLLADYFTKWPHVVLWDAIKNRDYAVWLSALGSFLLHLAIIVSTSVIALEPTAVSSPARFLISDAFVSSPPNISLEAVSGNALIRYFGINMRNLTYPTGTSANLTIASFSPSTVYPDNSTYLATVSGMSATLQCEPIPSANLTNVTTQPWVSILAPIFTTNISVDGCNINGVPIGMGVQHDPPVVDTTSAFQGWWNNYTCNDGLNNAEYQDVGDKPIIEGFTDQRLIFMTSLVQWTARLAPNVTRKTWVQNYTGIICKPHYSIDYYDVELSPANLHTKEPYQARIKEGTSRKIDLFADIDLAALIKRDSLNSLIVQSAQRDVQAKVSANRGYLRSEDPFFTAMTGNNMTSSLSNQTEMLRKIPEAFSAVAAQAFQEYFTVSASRQLDGTAQVFANRLRAKAVPIGLMLTFLSLLIIISIALIFLSPWDCVPSNPQSIAAKAKYLAASPNLAYHLRALNGLNMHQLYERFEGSRYRTVLAADGREFVIVPESEAAVSGAAAGERELISEASNVWWKPLNHRVWFISLIVFSPLAIIAILQVLQHISDIRDGIRDVTDLGSRRIWVTLIPAAILSIVAVSFQSMHFNACLTSPFNALKHGSVSHSRGLTVSMLGKTSPHVLFMGFKHHLFLPCITAFCVMVGAFLTIVVSGLYFVQDVPIFEQVTLQRADVFNFTKQDLSLTDSLAGVTTKLLFREGLPDPQLIHNDLVFPAVTVQDTSLVSNGSSVEVQLPAIRPRLHCFSNDVNSITYNETITYSEDTGLSAEYQSSFDFPCPGNSSICQTSWDFGQRIQANQSKYTSGWSVDVTTTDCLGQDIGWNYVLQLGCPSLTFAIGKTAFRPLNETTIRQSKPEIHAFICFAYLEEVQTKVTLLLPEYAISNATGQTPVTMEDTARNLTFSSSNYSGPIYTNALSTLFHALGRTNEQFDALADAINQGKDNKTATDLPAAEQASELQSRASALYATYMVNAISSNFRVTPSEFDRADSSQSQPADMLPGTTYSGLLSQIHRERLKQDPNTTIALQVMLAVMSVLAISVFFLTDRGLRLPTNPCSIAGTMVLLAGSEMTSRNVVPMGSEWDRKTRIWEGWLFSLGWWSDGRGKRFGIDIGNAATGVTGAVGIMSGNQQPRYDDPGPPPAPPVPPVSPDASPFPNQPEHTRAQEVSYSAELGTEEHEMKHMKRFTPVSVEVPSSVMGWNDSEYRYSLTKQPTSSSRSNESETRSLHHQQQQQQQLNTTDSGDVGIGIGIAHSTSPSHADEIERLSDKYRSRVARQYQSPR